MDDPNQFHGLAADQLTDDIVEQPVSINGIAHNIKRSDFMSLPLVIQ
ncbi:hypothetical protein ECEC1845_3519 [Escherichia coli EC1845]|nr:hypothetical protein UM146_04470 [Escherichia coli UM146]EFZ54802.1 hypothetical protein SS53G_0666 [Shigella sonnei 53G]EGR62504.1 hypothetical protein HUSEC41_13396 [Escherichia coli O104:H4 str. 01-09591]EGR73515.1 hypothetical protein HUSEC_13698 [Escherichia coli O104:H4 str. LB226692]EID67494.1 hypothetical protein ECW26_21230 [Escherichia coli W26]EIL70850.1 hypothetical protein ECHM605_24959 [Escherichia coli HM605]EIP26866.1 hypothetical protein ECEC4013_3752 [Escherichia coli EC4